MAQTPPDNPRDETNNAAPGNPGDLGDPGASQHHYELADHPDEMDDGPPPAVPSSRPKPKPTTDGPSHPAGDAATPQPDAAPPGDDAATTPTPAPPSHCPHCKKPITGKLLAGNCPHCGKRIADPSAGVEQSTKHATAALVLGVLSIPLGLISIALLNPIFGSVLGAILGGVAVHFARQAKQEIAEGYAPATSEGAANLGHLCGIIGVVLGCALTLFYAALQLIAFALEF